MSPPSPSRSDHGGSEPWLDPDKPPLDVQFYRFLVSQLNDLDTPKSAIFAALLIHYAWRNGSEEQQVERTRDLMSRPEMAVAMLPQAVLDRLKHYNVWHVYFDANGKPIKTFDKELVKRFMQIWGPWLELARGNANKRHHLGHSTVVQIPFDNTVKEPHVVDLVLDDDDDEAPLVNVSRDRNGHLRLKYTGSGGPIDIEGFLREYARRYGEEGTSDVEMDDEEAQPTVPVPDRTGRDWVVDSHYLGTEQPPLAQRLTHLLTFLSDEDVDRCMGFEGHFQEAGRYLHWLWHVDETGQIHRASPETRLMFRQAVLKMKVHRLFEEYHYTPTPLVLGPPMNVPPPTTRLNWAGPEAETSRQLPPLSVRPSPPSRRLPARFPPRPRRLVNGQLEANPANSTRHELLKAAEREFWNSPTIKPNNLFEMESDYFSSILNSNSPGWVRTHAKTGLKKLPDGELVLPKDARVWAKQRGAMRAGLQQTIRGFHSLDHPYVSTPFRRLVLPLEPSERRRIREQIEGRPWQPPGEKRERMPDVLDPQAHGQVWKEWSLARASRRTFAVEAYEVKQNDVKLPPNLVMGGPVLFRGTDKHTQDLQDTLATCHVLRKALKLAEQRFPRPLIKHVNSLIEAGKAGAFKNETIPNAVKVRITANGEAELSLDHASSKEATRGATKTIKPDCQLRKDEFVGRTIRYLDNADDHKWLLHLSGECFNDQNGQGSLGYEEAEHTMFRIFAKRLFKVLADGSPDALFPTPTTVCSLEEVLARMNTGFGTAQNVRKVQFAPHDGWAFCERLGDAGFITYEEDPTCYCTVAPPPYTVWPEHAVVWPSDDQKKPVCASPGGLFPPQAFDAQARPAVGRGSEIWNFFSALGVRLGHTLYRLGREEKAGWSAAPNRSWTALAKAVGAFEARFAESQKGNPKPSLAELAARADPTNSSIIQEMTETQALRHVGTRMVDELASNLTMLYPSRIKYSVATGTETPSWDHTWDWAAPSARGRRRQFWTMDRWPLGLGWLTADQERHVRSGRDVDPLHAFDPSTWDVTGRDHMQPKLRPYIIEDVEYKPGPAVFPIGDTFLQETRIQDAMTAAVEKALGIDKKRWRFTDIFGAPDRGDKPFGHRPGVEYLPHVSQSAVPSSWDPETERIHANHERRVRLDREKAERHEKEHQAALNLRKRARKELEEEAAQSARPHSAVVPSLAVGKAARVLEAYGLRPGPARRDRDGDEEMGGT